MESALQQHNTFFFNRNRVFTGLLLTAIILYTALTFFYSPDPRGSDQYWNIGNVDRVVHQDGKFRTNNIFPAGLPETLQDLPRPWVQNRPVVYLVTALAFLVNDPHFAWIVMNCIFMLACLAMLYRIMKQDESPHRGWMLASLVMFLFIPLNFYLGMQGLPEVFNEMLTLVIAVILISPVHVLIRALLAGLVTGILLYQRDNYLLLFVLITLFFFRFESGGKRFSAAAVFLMVASVCYLMKPYLFPAHTIKPIPVLSLVAEVRRGNSNMVNYLFPNLPAQDFGNLVRILIEKSWRAMTMQFTPGGEDAVFRYPVNLLMLPVVVLLIRFRSLSLRRKQIVFITAGFIVLHFLTIMVFENQYRFSSILIPLLLLCFYYFTGLFTPKQAKFSTYVTVMLIGLFLVADLVIGTINKREAAADKTFIGQVREYKNIIGDETVMVPYYGGRSLIIGYSISPNYCYYFAGHMDKDKLWHDAEKLGASLVIYRNDIRFARDIQDRIIEEYPVGNNHTLARIRTTEN